MDRDVPAPNTIELGSENTKWNNDRIEKISSVAKVVSLLKSMDKDRNEPCRCQIPKRTVI